MHRNISAELLLLRKRPSTWILLGLWTLMSTLFAYVLPYVSYLNSSGGPRALPLDLLLPGQLVSNMASGFPFYGGVIALVLGALAFGGEYGWGTVKTVLTQRPGRLGVFTAKLSALGIALTAFVLTPYVVGALVSYGIAVLEGAAVSWPAPWLLLRALGAGWFLLAVWAAFGSALAVLFKGTALPIAVGILYGLVIEGLVSAFAGQISFLEPVVEAFLRANGYSLIEPLGVVGDDGPGAFSGPYVGALQAFVVLAGYLTAFAVLAAVLLRRRDVA